MSDQIKYIDFFDAQFDAQIKLLVEALTAIRTEKDKLTKMQPVKIVADNSGKEAIELQSELQKLINSKLRIGELTKLEGNTSKAVNDLEIAQMKSRLKAQDDIYRAKEKEETQRKKEVGDINQLKKAYNEMNAERNSMTKITGENIKRFNELTVAMNKNKDEQKKYAEQLGNYQSRVGQYYNEITRSIVTMTAGIFGLQAVIGIFKNGLNDIIAFQKSISNLSAITGIVGKDLNYLRKQAVDLGMDVEGGAEAVAESFKLIASANSDLANSPSAIAEIAKQAKILSQASGIELQDATKALMQILNKMGVEAIDASKSIDILAASTKYGTAEMPQVIASFLEFGGTMKLVSKNTNSANDNVREANALIQVLAKNGKLGAEAGTGLRNVLLAIAAVDVLPKKAQAELKEWGVNLTILKDKTLPLSDRLKELNKISGDAGAMVKVFGKENLEVGKIVLDNIPLFEQYNGQLKTTGVAADQAATNMNNLAGDLTKAKSSWTSFILSLESGEGTTAKFLRGIVQMFSSITTMWSRSESGEFKGKESFALMGEGGDKAIAKTNELASLEMKSKVSGTLEREGWDKPLNDTMKQYWILKTWRDEIAKTEAQLIYDRAKAEQMSSFTSQDEVAKLALSNALLKTKLDYLKQQYGLLTTPKGTKTSEPNALGLPTDPTKPLTKDQKTEIKDELKNKEEGDKAWLDLEQNTEDIYLGMKKIVSGVLEDQDMEDSQKRIEMHKLLIQQQKDNDLEYLEWQKDRRKEQLEVIRDTMDKAKGIFTENTIAYKLIASAEASMNTYISVTRALKAFDPPLNYIFAAINGAIGLANVAKINNVKFAEGVVDLRGPGTETSDSIPARLSVGESVLTAKNTRDAKKIITGIHEGYITDSNLIIENSNTNSSSNYFETKRLEEKLERQIEATERMTNFVRKIGTPYPSKEGFTTVLYPDGSIKVIINK